MLARLFSRTSVKPVDALNEDTGLTMSQIQVLLEEVQYQDNTTLALLLQAQAMTVPAIASIMGGMMGGGSPDGATKSLEAILNMARNLLEGKDSEETVAEKKMTEKQKKEADALLETHPLFRQFYAERGAESLNDINVMNPISIG